VAAPVAAPAKEVDLLGGFLDGDAFSGDGSTFAAEKALPALTPPPASIDDDEFADFQAAPIAPQPSLVASKPNLMDMLQSNTTARPPAVSSFNQVAHQSQPTIYGNNNSHNNFGTTSGNRMSYTPASVPAQQLFGGGAPMKPTSPPMKPTSPPLMSSPLAPASNSPKPSANFDDLWSMSLGSASAANSAKPFGSAAAPAGGGKSIKDLEKEKALAGLWGSAGVGRGQGQGMGSFGGFGGMGVGGAASASSTAVGNGDDLLL